MCRSGQLSGQYYTFTAVEEKELHVTTIYYKVTTMIDDK